MLRKWKIILGFLLNLERRWRALKDNWEVSYACEQQEVFNLRFKCLQKSHPSSYWGFKTCLWWRGEKQQKVLFGSFPFQKTKKISSLLSNFAVQKQFLPISFFWSLWKLFSSFDFLKDSKTFQSLQTVDHTWMTRIAFRVKAFLSWGWIAFLHRRINFSLRFPT